MDRIVIIGGGQAACSLAARLRARDFAGSVTIIADEPVPPYQRPPLSKKYLLGEMDLERLFLRPESFYAENDIDLRTGTRALAIDRAERTVRLDDGTVAYDQLVLATGARPRRLPPEAGGHLEGVHVVRTLADVDAMAPAFVPGARVLVVGGGYIGLEAAAVAAQRGLAVTLVEAAPRILQRVASPETSALFRELHQRHGVRLREGVSITRLEGEGRVQRAILQDATTLEVDFVIVGIGVVPATELAEAAGISVENGIRVDAMGRTSDPAIWAAGDCASFPWRGRRIRLESVQNAIDQAERVADNILGDAAPYDPVPWFWSDQYDVKFQMVGLPGDHDRTIARRGERAGEISHWYFRGAELIGVDAMNFPRAYMIGKRLMEAGQSPAPELVADPDTDLRALLG
ncbi:MAG: NAD(P)/FAD-dependent oxidoreductase [Alphaproteobacteria bacterium]|nr:MAG: NAD(P)/FAD-dependent oxidoreductase [Alphaproteobacteria bacterium]